jgi:hypothetical protein
MKRKLFAALAGMCVIATLVPAASYAFSRSSSCFAHNSGGEGTLNATHYYSSKDATHWYTSALNFKCSGTRPHNNVSIWLKSGSTTLATYSSGDILGGHQYSWKVARTSLKGSTLSHYYYVCDVNNWPDPNASMDIGPF